MYFLKIGRNLFNIKNEILGFEFPKEGEAKIYLNSSDTPLTFTGMIAEALSWFFSIAAEPRQADGSHFFVFDLIWGYKNRKGLEANSRLVGTPQSDPAIPVLIDTLRTLSERLTLTNPAATTSPAGPSPMTITHQGPEPPLAAPVRAPRLNTAKIQQAVSRRGTGPAEFFPGEQKNPPTPGQPA